MGDQTNRSKKFTDKVLVVKSDSDDNLLLACDVRGQSEHESIGKCVKLYHMNECVWTFPNEKAFETLKIVKIYVMALGTQICVLAVDTRFRNPTPEGDSLPLHHKMIVKINKRDGTITEKIHVDTSIFDDGNIHFASLISSRQPNEDHSNSIVEDSILLFKSQYSLRWISTIVTNKRNIHTIERFESRQPDDKLCVCNQHCILGYKTLRTLFLYTFNILPKAHFGKVGCRLNIKDFFMNEDFLTYVPNDPDVTGTFSCRIIDTTNLENTFKESNGLVRLDKISAHKSFKFKLGLYGVFNFVSQYSQKCYVYSTFSEYNILYCYASFRAPPFEIQISKDVRHVHAFGNWYALFFHDRWEFHFMNNSILQNIHNRLTRGYRAESLVAQLLQMCL